MKESKIYKNVWQVVVLSDQPLSESMSLEDVAYQIDEGDCVGTYSLSEQKEVVGEEAIVEACEEVGNDGSFFGYLLDNQENGEEGEDN